MKYVTFDEAGALTGAYWQDLQPEHVGAFIEVGDAQYAAWVTFRANAGRDGLEPADPVVPAYVIPKIVTRRQGRQALLLAGLLSSVQPAIDAIPDAMQRGLAQIEWDDAQEFDRQRPFLLLMASALGLSDAALDDLFIAAAKL